MSTKKRIGMVALMILPYFITEDFIAGMAGSWMVWTSFTLLEATKALDEIRNKTI